jgi:hypothetical protein
MQVSEKDRLENLFFTQGFQVSFVHYENIAKDLGLGPPSKQCGRVLFVAEQLRFSDAQVINPMEDPKHNFSFDTFGN